MAPNSAEPDAPRPGPSMELVRIAPTGYLAHLEISTELKRRIDDQLRQLRKRRGDVHQPEDVHEAVRLLAAWDLEIADYEQAMKAGRAHVLGALEEELIEVADLTGHADRPYKLTVQDGQTVITIDPSYKSTRDFDMDQVLAQLAMLAEDEWLDRDESPADDPVGFATEVATRFLGLHTGAKPGIKAITALAVLASSRKQDTSASIIRGACGEPKSTYQDKVSLKIEAA